LTSAQQALKTHLIPMTSLAARAHDIALQDAADTEAGAALGNGAGEARRDIARQLLKYLDTDTLLCWAPHADREGEVSRAAKAAAMAGPNPNAATAPSLASAASASAPRPSLRNEQERTALPITAFLSTHVWPGVEIRPGLTESSILPASQPEMTREVVRGWLFGLGAWELAGLERATLATKSLCIAARLVCEWSENFPRIEEDAAARFGVDEAEHACTVEVRWQTGQWGEVEDSHDVDREDLRRQLGGAVLLVSGTGA
jgi:chaperone required for assembly of F1-ATPase